MGYIKISCITRFIESKSWTPKILNDIVGGKKKSQLTEDNPLELLPEKRSTRKSKESSNATAAAAPSTEPSGNDLSVLDSAIDFLIHDLNILNCSSQGNSGSGRYQEMRATNAFEKALNDLFIQDYDEDDE
jgi:hypothetical protein